MPLYEYKCKECEKTFEVLQKINSEPLSECLHCKGQVEKLVSLSSFQLKGSGWYVSDYKNKSPKSSGSSRSKSSEVVNSTSTSTETSTAGK